MLNRWEQVRCSAKEPWWGYKKGRAWGSLSRGAARLWRKAGLCPHGAFMLLLPLLTLEKLRKMHLSAVLNYCFNKLAWKLNIQSLKNVRTLTIAVGKPASTLSWGNRRTHEQETQLPDCACLIIRIIAHRKNTTSCTLMVPPGQTELREPLARNIQKHRGSRISCNTTWKLLCPSQRAMCLLQALSKSSSSTFKHTFMLHEHFPPSFMISSNTNQG